MGTPLASGLDSERAELRSPPVWAAPPLGRENSITASGTDRTPSLPCLVRSRLPWPGPAVKSADPPSTALCSQDALPRGGGAQALSSRARTKGERVVGSICLSPIQSLSMQNNKSKQGKPGWSVGSSQREDWKKHWPYKPPAPLCDPAGHTLLSTM